MVLLSMFISRILNQVAPVPFKNIVEEMKDKDVEYFKGRAEGYFVKYVKPKLDEKITESSINEIITNDLPL